MHGSTNLPYIRHEPFTADDASEFVGGQVVKFTAGSQTLLIGDCVYLSAANTVDKSSTTANYVSYIGVVVGGTSTYFQCGSNDSDVGVTAALTGKEVLVQISGVAWVPSAAAFDLGDQLQVATTAGAVDDSTTTANCYVGVALSAAGGAAESVRMLIWHG